jgi:hypothetical protein
MLHRLHDAKVIAVTVDEANAVLELLLDCSGGFVDAKELLLRFSGVSDFTLPESLIGNWWLYEELDLAWNRGGQDDAGTAEFQVRALLSPSSFVSMNEISVTARNVEVVVTKPSEE